MTTTPTSTDPLDIFHEWMALAVENEPNDANAMTLASATKDGIPSARMVLLKDVDDRGFVFYTNLGSQKARELTENPVAALVFHWKSLKRQIRVTGRVEPVDEAQADAYYASRPRDSRIGAWASKQSQPLDGMFTLEARVAKYAAKFAVGEIPRPDFWSGFCVVPGRIEFWRDRAFRLHERVVYVRDDMRGAWLQERLYP